ncbi:hypothetical protein CHARACLAT_030922 [Characodon lateralis]|uniref:Vomeronasal type-1 receptor n=1 Tax=Characodon lateralis TaxID=208331 RepID=A0ABU7F0R0_9TELE|nr:hypothetical protein [Characodon lateralis]
MQVDSVLHTKIVCLTCHLLGFHLSVTLSVFKTKKKTKAEAGNTGADIVYVHTLCISLGVTAMCQGLCSLFQMAQQVSPRVLMIPALIDQGRGSHGLGACRLIAVAWPLGPLRPLKGSGVAQP